MKVATIHQQQYICELCSKKYKSEIEAMRCERHCKLKKSIDHCTEFEITAQHLMLIKKMHIHYDWYTEYGAPTVDPKRPYGNSYVEKDILSILGLKGDIEEDDGSRSCSEELADELYRLHAETTVALQICLQFAEFAEGKYVCEPYRYVWKKKSEGAE